MTRVVCGILLAAVAGCAGREWARDYHGYVPGTEPDTTCVFHVVDRRTGRPIPNATVVQHPEWLIDENGDWAPAWARTKTDRHGLAWFVLDEDPGTCHWAIHADGYSPTEEFGGLGLQISVELRRGWEQAGRLLRYDGVPLADALVEFKVGCAHAPALRTTRTDRDGVFVLRNVKHGDLPFEHPRCRAAYWYGPPPRPHAHGVPSYTTDPGFTITGRVVRPDGTPPRWCVLTTSDRGARAKVDADGRFVLHGTSPGGTISLWTHDALFNVDASEYRPDGPLLLRLQETQPHTEETEPVVVNLTGAPAESVRVHLDRISDGRRFSVWSYGTSPGDAAEFDVPAGRYLLSVGAPSSRYRAADTELVVRGATTAALKVHEQARLRLSMQPSDEFSCRIVLENRIWAFSPDLPAYLPADAPAWLRVSIGHDAYTFPVGPARDGVRLAQVRLPGLKRIRVGGDDAWLHNDHSGTYIGGTLETYAVGRRRVVVVDDDKGRAVRELDLGFAESTLDVDDLVFEKGGTLRVLDAEGRPFADASVDVYPSSRADDAWWPDNEGGWRSAALRDGAFVRVSSSFSPSNLVPLTTRLRGDGPYEVRLGDATIEVDVGGLEDAAVLVDGATWRRPDDDGRVVLSRVTAGPHDVVVGARGRIGKAYRVVLREREVRRLAPDLKPR